MARPFVEELPTQDVWAVVRDALDGTVADWDLTLRTINDVMSYASYAALTYIWNQQPMSALSAKAAIDQLAAGGVAAAPAAFDWKAILSLLVQWLIDRFLK